MGWALKGVWGRLSVGRALRGACRRPHAEGALKGSWVRGNIVTLRAT